MGQEGKALSFPGLDHAVPVGVPLASTERCSPGRTHS